MSRVLTFSDAPTASSSSSSKAPFRPGKIPSSSSRPSVKRNDSIVSLPSPPDEGPLQPAFNAQSLSRTKGLSDSDVDIDDAADFDRAQRDPFGGGGARARPVQPDHPQVSPTQAARRRRVDKERIKVVTPAAFVGAKGMAKKPLGGLEWESPSNPFVVKSSDAHRMWTPGHAKKPEKLTYVFRGKRITYDLPFDALVAQDPEDSPFAEPSPRLLYPPPPPITPPSSHPSSSFLDALRASMPEKPVLVDHGLPTPARERVRNSDGSRKDARFGPYKRATVDDDSSRR